MYHKKYFNNLVETADKERVNLIHPGYGSVGRIAKKERGWYDFAILNPEFVRTNYYKRVQNNHEKNICGHKPDDLLAVFELKFVDRQGTAKYMRDLETDYKKLEKAVEALKRYLVVFSFVKNDKSLTDFLKSLEWNSSLKLIYIKTQLDNKHKKYAEILIEPDNFLDLKPTSGFSIKS